MCRGDKYAEVADQLKQCGWLSVKQLVFFHSVVLVYKTILTTYLKYIYNKLSTQFPYNTSLANTEAVRMGSKFQSKSELTQKSSMNRATTSYNLIPTELRKVPKLELFKKKLKIWVMENIKLDLIYHLDERSLYCNILPSLVAKKNVKMYLILK